MAAEVAPRVERRVGAEVPPPAKVRPGRRDLRPLGRLWPFVRADRRDAVLAGVFLVLSTAATIGLTFAARMVVDKGLASHTAELIDRSFAILAMILIALALATAGRFFFTARLGERVVADLRTAIYGHVLTLDPGYFLKVRTGEVLSRLTTDLTIVESMLGASISVALRNLLIVVASLGVLVFIAPTLIAFVVVLAAVILAPLIVVGRRVRRLSAQAQTRFAEAVGYAGETLDALDTIQAFGRETASAGRFSRAVEIAFGASVARIGARAIMTVLVMVLVAGGVGLVLWRASLAAYVDHSMSSGSLAQFVLLSVLAAGSAGSLSETWGDVQKASGAMERIAELLDARPAIAAPAAPRPLPVPPRGEIAMEKVVFAYPGRPDLPALDGLDLAVRPGERVALVGPSGAGKTTVFRLLLRFYDPTSGVVRVDGVDVREADPAEVRKRIAVVAQDAPLFSGSALDNLRVGGEEATPARLRAAARAAEAEGFLSALPLGFDTPLGERAKTLSG
ncbi:MAG: ABC transporter transmembrane domain-containing protein, partial [Caulobacteraceae bacterium]